MAYAFPALMLLPALIWTHLADTHIRNAVPVELGRAIGESIKKHIEEATANEQG